MTSYGTDLAEFFDPDLHLTIRGKVFTVVSPGGAEGIRISRLLADSALPVVEQALESVKILGPSLIDDMVAHDVAYSEIFHAGRTALLHYGFSPDMGKLHWGMGRLGSQDDIDNLRKDLG